MKAEELLERCGAGPEWDKAYYDALTIIDGDAETARHATKQRVRERRYAEVRAHELRDQHEQQHARALARQLRRTRR